MTFDEYLEGVVKHLKTPAAAVNEGELLAWCEQKWNSRPANGWTTEKVCKSHAAEFDQAVINGLGFNRFGSDRARKQSTRTS